MGVTFVILTKNEEINIVDCIKSIEGFAERVIVVDSGSDDNTCQIAKNMGADVYYHPFEYYAKQFNWALDNCNITSKWTFRFDADERLTPELCEELNGLMKKHDSDDVNGIIIQSWLFFLGRKIKYGCPNKRKLMMFKTGLGRIEDRKRDAHTILISGVSVSCVNKFIHYDFKDLNQWINKMNWYATREMQDYIEYLNGEGANLNLDDPTLTKIRKQKFGFYYKLPMFIRCWMLFIYNYIFKLGFLDGKEGFIYNYMFHRWYRTLVDAKIYEQLKYNNPFEKLEDLK